jgi:3-hydroxybutyryl-CoA dehydratase
MAVTDAIGKEARFSKTVADRDVAVFADLTDDFSPNHTDEVAMAATPYGGRIVHGALLVGYMSGFSVDIQALCPSLKTCQAVALGFDRVRFLKAVMIGDTVNVHYRVVSADIENSRTIADITVHNQYGELCVVATHIMTWIAPRV